MSLWQNFKDYILDKTGMQTLLNRTQILEDNRDNQEILAAITFNHAIAESEWLKHKAFFPGRWAVEYTFLLSLYRILSHHEFKNLLEFGLGQTSRMVHQYATFYNVPATTVEHDEEWIRFTQKDIKKAYPINTKVLPLEMIDYKGYSTRTYQGVKDAFTGQKFDFILVDGPFGSEHYSRSQIIHLAENNLAETFCIIIDDTNRIGEQETIEEIKNTLSSKGFKFSLNTYSGKSDHTVICSENLKFLTSL